MNRAKGCGIGMTRGERFMPSDVQTEPGSEPGAERVLFDYIKGNDFRTVHADGFIGGLTPNGSLHFATYCERLAIPRRVAHRPNPDGTLGEPIPEETVTRGSIVREMSADIFVSYGVAVELRDWLSERIKELDERAEIVKKLGI